MELEVLVRKAEETLPGERVKYVGTERNRLGTSEELVHNNGFKITDPSFI